MATLEKLMLDKTVAKMKRFNMNEMQKLLKILHLNLAWKDVVDRVSECRLRLSVANVVSVLQQYLKDSDAVEETYHRVLLVDAIFHQSSHWWTVSVDKSNKRLLDQTIIRNNVQAMVDKLNIRAITYVLECNRLFWVLINIVDPKRKRGAAAAPCRLTVPYFFTIAPGKVLHVFHRPQNVDRRLLNVVIKSVGAKKCRPYALSGKHLQSMAIMLEDKNKENNRERQNVQLADNYQEDDVREYVQQLFGDQRRVLNEFTINVNSHHSASGDEALRTGKMYKTRVELKGDSVMDGVKDMMMSGVLQPPYPDWVTRLPVLGKNYVNVDIRP